MLFHIRAVLHTPYMIAVPKRFFCNLATEYTPSHKARLLGIYLRVSVKRKDNFYLINQERKKNRFLRLKLLLCWRNTIQSVTQILYKTWFIFLSDENMPVDAEKRTLGYQDIVSTVNVEKLKFQVLFIMKPFSKVTTDWLLKFWWWKCDA